MDFANRGGVWRSVGPASEEDLKKLRRAFQAPLPDGYVELLRFSNGGEGELGAAPGWFAPWPAADVMHFNRIYEVPERLPGLIGFGSNGAAEMFAFDTRRKQPWPVLAIPFVADDVEQATWVAKDFDAFLALIAVTAPQDSSAATYESHTHHELELMLAGKKPLAAFCDDEQAQNGDEEIPEPEFAPHVASGRLIKREHLSAPTEGGADVEGQAGGVRWVFYALPGHEWRIEALILLLKTAAVTGWNEGFERMQGSLLGYEDWENDLRMKQKGRWWEQPR
jgi:hypothetical protein